MPLNITNNTGEKTTTATTALVPNTVVPTEEASTTTPGILISPTEAANSAQKRSFLSRVHSVWMRFMRREKYPALNVTAFTVLVGVAGVLVGRLLPGWEPMVAAIKGAHVGEKSAIAVFGPPLIQVGGGLIAGIVALWQYNKGHRQRDDHLAKTRRSAQRQADRKERTDRDLALRKELHDQFGDIQNRLASSDPIIRANAALRLSQFGETLKPGVKEGRYRSTENYPYFTPAVSQLALALYLEPNLAVRKAVRESFKNLILFAKTPNDDQPLLHLLIERLADANRTARDAFIRAFAEWSVISKEWNESTTEDAVTAYNRHGENFSDYLQESVMEFIASIAPFCRKRSETIAVINSLAGNFRGVHRHYMTDVSWSGLFKVQREKYRQRRDAQADTIDRAKNDALLLPTLDNAAQQLIDTRDVLASALLALDEPESFPFYELERTLSGPPKSLTENEHSYIPNRHSVRAALGLTPHDRRWKRAFPLDLWECFLCGADLPEAKLQGVNFHLAELRGADLSGAKMQGADLSCANLQGACLIDSDVQCANFNKADLQSVQADSAKMQCCDFLSASLKEADFSRVQAQSALFVRIDAPRVGMELARLEGANFTMAGLYNAQMKGASLQKARLNDARLDGASFLDTNMEDTWLYGVHVSESKSLDCDVTIFPPDVLESARFDWTGSFGRNSSSTKRTEKVKAWLKGQVQQRPNDEARDIEASAS